MRVGMRVAAVVILAAALPGTAPAELKHESRDEATDVFTGKVVSVYKQTTRSHDQYVVEIAVDKVEKGDTARSGATVYTFCFKKRPDFDKPTGAGHKLIPEIGQQLKVYIKHDNGRNSGIYPDWADVLK
jgi:hypothetical protein